MKRVNPLVLILLAALAAPVSSLAQDAPRPAQARPLEAPRGFDEGTEYRLSSAQVQELLPWAYQTEREIRKLLSSASAIANAREQRDFLVDGVKAISLHSDQKRTELLLRYVLNRAVKINEVIEQESDTRVPGVIDQQIRLALRSIDLALEYFQSDIDFLKEVEAGKAADLTHLPFAAFGKEYAALLMSLNASILDSSAQYRVGVMGLGLLAWDLFRDQDQKRYAPAILELKRVVDQMPESPAATDRENLSRIRLVRKAYREFLALDGAENPRPPGLGSGPAPAQPPVATAPARPTQPERRIRPGDRVIDRGDNRGRVQEISASGTAFVVFDAVSDGPRRVSELSVQVNRLGSLEPGTRVIDRRDNHGRVGEIFANGRVYVTFDVASDGFRNADELSHGVQRSSRFEVGTRVIDERNNRGRIGELFSNDRAFITFDVASDGYRDLRNLAIAVSSLEGFSTGQRVADSHNNRGRIAEIFDNRVAYVTFDVASDGYRALSDLSALSGSN